MCFGVRNRIATVENMITTRYKRGCQESVVGARNKRKEETIRVDGKEEARGRKRVREESIKRKRERVRGGGTARGPERRQEGGI